MDRRLSLSRRDGTRQLRSDRSHPDDTREQVGLCATCQWSRRIASVRGSIFYMCERSNSDPAFPKYPRLPVLQCAGYTPETD
jgi:hypothetical protein